MRERNLSINIRVTENEKINICRKAKRAGLSLSEYIRKCALGQSVRSASNKHLKQAYQLVCQMNDSRLDKIKELLLNACMVMTDNGCNKKFGQSRTVCLVLLIMPPIQTKQFTLI